MNEYRDNKPKTITEMMRETCDKWKKCFSDKDLRNRIRRHLSDEDSEDDNFDWDSIYIPNELRFLLFDGLYAEKRNHLLDKHLSEMFIQILDMYDE
jgi:hypothetical protein